MADYSNGADFSLWDAGPKPFKNILNWPEYKWIFAFIKVGEALYKDPAFDAQWRAARGWTHRGAYHLFRVYADPVTSVENVLSYLGSDRGELPIMFDLEYANGFDDSVVMPKARAWLNHYEKRTGTQPIIYSSPGFLGDMQATRYPWLKEYKLLLASYFWDRITPIETRQKILFDVLNRNRPFAFPTSPAPFIGQPSFIQWTGRGSPEWVGGYYRGGDAKKEVDLIFYRGNESDLIHEFRLGPLPEPEEVPPMTEWNYKITPKNSDGSNIRSGPNTSQAPIGKLPFGKFAYGMNAPYKVGDQEEWLPIIEADGQQIAGWVAARHLGVEYATITILNTSPTPTPTPATEEFHIDIDIVNGQITGHISGVDKFGTPFDHSY